MGKKRLSEKEMQIQALLDVAGVIFVALNRKGEVTLINKKGCRILGYPQEEILGKNWFKHYLHPEDRKKTEKVFKKLMRGNEQEVEYFQQPVLTRKGLRMIAWHNAIIRDEKGQVAGTLSSGEDVTELQQANDKLTQSVREYEQLYNSLNEGMAVHEMLYDDRGRAIDYRILDVNPAFEEILGLDKRKTVGRLASKAYNTDRAPYLDVYQKVIKTGKAIIFDTYFEPMQKHFRISVFTPQKGRFVTVFSDVTEQKKQAEVLEKSEQQFRDLFERSSDGMLIADPKTKRFIDANAMIRQMLQYSRQEIKQLSVKDIHPPENRKEIFDLFESIVKKNNPNIFKDIPLVRKDGELFYADLKNFDISIEGKRYLVGVFRDTTELKKIESIKKDLIRSLSHGLKTPLAMLEMSLHMWEVSMQKGEEEQAVISRKVAKNNVARMKRDIKNILELFSLDLRKGLFHRKARKISLKTGIERVLEDLNYYIESKQIKIKVSFDPKAVKISLDKMDLDLLLGNIVENAVKFTEKGSIRIRSRRREHHVELHIKDSGKGIAPKDLPRVFERFYQSTPANEGSGLGLSIAHEIISLYNGEIEIKSRGLGKGTSVILRFPEKIKIKQ